MAYKFRVLARSHVRLEHANYDLQLQADLTDMVPAKAKTCDS